MQMVEINSKNVDNITREGKTYLYFTAGVQPLCGGHGAGLSEIFDGGGAIRCEGVPHQCDR